jgi:hypothetical protein
MNAHSRFHAIPDALHKRYRQNILVGDGTAVADHPDRPNRRKADAGFWLREKTFVIRSGETAQL